MVQSRSEPPHSSSLGKCSRLWCVGNAEGLCVVRNDRSKRHLHCMYIVVGGTFLYHVRRCDPAHYHTLICRSILNFKIQKCTILLNRMSLKFGNQAYGRTSRSLFQAHVARFNRNNTSFTSGRSPASTSQQRSAIIHSS